MKTTRYLSTATLGFLLATTGAGADPNGYNSPDDSADYDPQGAPRVQKQHTQAEIDAYRKQQEKAASDKDWLVRSYEQQLQARNKANASKEQSANLYYQLSTNKELAKLAGLPSLDIESENSATTYRTGANPAGRSAVGLRVDTPSALGNKSALRVNLLKPLITPLSAPDAAGIHNFYSSLPVSMAPSFSGSVSQTASTPRADQSMDSSDLGTPGMVAARKDPMADMSSSELTLDILPGETAEHARAYRENNTKLELPLPMDVDQLHKKQASTLNLPTLPTAAKTGSATPPVAQPVKALPVEEDPNAPMPVDKAAPINPVRAPIANPYDILNH